MTGAMYAAIGGLRSHMSKLNVIGNNLANVNTYGYKSQRMTFRESIYGTTRSGSNGGVTNGGNNPSQTGYGCSVATIDLNMSPSTYAPTGIDLDCYIDGDGFFLLGGKLTSEPVYATAEDVEKYRQLVPPIEIKEGDLLTVDWTGGVTSGDRLKDFTLSRVGDFWIDPDGYVCNGDGMIVYGFARVQNPYYIPNATEDQIAIAKIAGIDITSQTTISTQMVPLRVPLQAAKPTLENGGIVAKLKEDGTYDLTADNKLQPSTDPPTYLWEEGDPVYPYLGIETADRISLNQYADPDVSDVTKGQIVTNTWPNTNPALSTASDRDTIAAELKKVADAARGKSQMAVAENTAQDRVSNVLPCQLRTIAIGTDGSITASANGKTVTLGYIAIATADNPNGVTHTGGPYFKCLPGAGNLRVSTCGIDMPAYLGNKVEAQGVDKIWNEKDTQLQSQGLEASSTDVAYEFAELVTTQRGYQANTRIVSVTDSMLEELVNMKR